MASNNIKPSKYPVGPDEQEALYDQAVEAGRAGKQDTLVSGTNIKTINGTSVLGSGDLTVSASGATWGSITGTLSSQTDLSTALSSKQATLVSGTNIKTVNGSSILGSGNITVSSGVTLVAKKNNINTFPLSINHIIASEDISSSIGLGMLQVTAMFRKTMGTQSYVPRLYINSSVTLTGATLIATLGTIASLNTIGDNIVNFCIDSSNNLYATNTGGTLFLRYNTGAGTIVALPSPCYLIWAGQLTNATDQAVLINSNVIKYA